MIAAPIATAALLISQAQPALTQTLRGVTIEAEPLPPMAPARSRATTLRQTQPAQFPDRPTVARPTAHPDTASVDTDSDAAQHDGDTPEPPVPTGLRLAARDGDLSQSEPATEPDGIPAAQQPYINPDGTDTVRFDARSPEDAAAFDEPPAGHDPSLFLTEITPLADRRPERLFRFRPWEPRGIRMGTFVVMPSILAGAAWVSNVARTPSANSDKALELRPEILARSNWRSNAVEFRATGAFSYFDRFSSFDDRGYALEARGRLDVTRRTQLSAQVLRDVIQEQQGTLETRLRGGARNEVTSDEARLTLDQRFNRLSFQLRGSMVTRRYAAAGNGVAGASGPSDRDVNIGEAALRTTWTFNPALNVFGETALSGRDFKLAAASDGISRDSQGERHRVGVGFGNTGQVLRGEISVGYGRQTPGDERLRTIDGVIVDANIGWRIDALNALLLSASSDVVDTTSVGSGGGLTRRVAADFRHAFLRPLIGTVGVARSATSYSGIDLSERLTEGTLGVEYYFGPGAVLYSRWQHTMYRTNSAGADWNADEVRVGIKLTR